ncbi:MAG: hypothetical protein ABIH26_03915 [Candidatus Eisenbacteria bacterium]
MKHNLHPPARFVAIALVASFLLIWGCGGDDGDNGMEPDLITIEDFAGTWNAAAFQMTANANPAMMLDLIAIGGSLTMISGATGAFTATALIPNPQTMELDTIPLAGYYSLLSQDSVTIAFTPEIPPLFTDLSVLFTLDEDTLDILNEDTLFDFDEDGTEEETTFYGRMVR